MLDKILGELTRKGNTQQARHFQTNVRTLNATLTVLATASDALLVARRDGLELHMAHFAPYCRSGLIGMLAQEFVRTARAKGLPERSVVLRHGLRNALIPVVTIVGLSLPVLISGAAITETIFGWPGMGRLAVDGAESPGGPGLRLPGSTRAAPLMGTPPPVLVSAPVPAAPAAQRQAGMAVPIPRRLGRLHSTRLVTRVALVFLVVAHVAVAIGLLVVRTSPEAVDPAEQFAPPSAEHLLGTDEAGRDVLARVFQGGRVSLGIGLAAMLVAITLGTLVGGLSGYFGGGIDSVLMRLTDGMLALPTFFLLLVIAALFGTSAGMLVIVIGLTAWMGVARVIRSEFLRWRGREFIEAARCLGADHTRIMLRHLLPQAVPSLSVAATIGVSVATLTESGLSYLGLGIPPPEASWGNLLLNAQSYLYRDRLLAVYPGLLVLLVVLRITSSAMDYVNGSIPKRPRAESHAHCQPEYLERLDRGLAQAPGRIRAPFDHHHGCAPTRWPGCDREQLRRSAERTRHTHGRSR